jgi:transcriptional regulator with XRE-family HTH domain
MKGGLLLDRQGRLQSYEKLKRLVSDKKTTVYRVASDLEIPRSTFSDWKSGRSMPNTEKLLKISNYFDVGIEYFIT